MGNAAQLVVSSGADQSAVQLVATFNSYGDDSYASPVRFCSRVVLVSGLSPSYAFVGMPCKDFPADEQAFNIALKKGGPAGSILLRSRCAISYSEGPGQSVNLLNGNLVKYGHNINEDSIVGEVYDDRWILGKITVFGRYVWDPSAGLCYYDAASPLTFNKMGFPDCMDSQYGPVFAPSFKFGWKNGNYEQSSESSPGSASSSSRSWTVEDAILYFRNFYGANSFKGSFLNSQLDYGTTSLPSFIRWDKSAGHFDGSSRTLKDVNVNNESLLSALQGIARKGGAIDLYMQPLPGMMSNVVFLQMNPKTNTGSRLLLPDYGGGSISDFMNDGQIIQSGYVSESVINQFDDTTICGDSAAVERFCQTKPDSTFTVRGQPCLEPADDGDFELAMDYIRKHKGTKDASTADEAFRSATIIWPDFLCSYRVFRNTPVFGDTKWGDHSLGIRYPRIKPAQLTAFNNGDQNPRNFQPREIRVEWKLTPNEIRLRVDRARVANLEKPGSDLWTPDDAHIWLPANPYDNLTLSPDSTILYLSAMRDSLQTWACELPLKSIDDGGGKHHLVFDVPTDYLGNADPRYIIRRQIRLNLAIESDWVITGRNKTDPNNTARRIEAGAPKFTWLTVSQPMDYVDYTRVKSRPNGNAQIQEPWKTQNYRDKCTLGNELFSDISSGRLADHASKRQADVNRIDYSGELFIARMNPALVPGLPLSVDGNETIETFAVIKCSIFDANAQGVTVQFGPPDSKEIYDMPGKYSGSHGPSSGSGQSTPTTTTPDGGKGGYKIPGTDEETGGKSNTQETTTNGGKRNDEVDDYDYNDGNGGIDGKKKVAGANDEKTERGPVKTTSDEKKSSTPGSETNYSWGAQEDKNPKKGNAARGEEAKAARLEAKEKHDARNPGIGEDGFGFGVASNGMDKKANTGMANIGKDLGFGNAGSGRMTPGERGGSHRNWDTNATRDGKNAKGQMPDHSSYDLNNPNNPMWKKKAGAVPPAAQQAQAKAQEKAQQFAPNANSSIKKPGQTMQDYNKSMDAAKANGLGIGESKPAPKLKPKAKEPDDE